MEARAAALEQIARADVIAGFAGTLAVMARGSHRL
jgi:hypothetical protein